MELAQRRPNVQGTSCYKDSKIWRGEYYDLGLYKLVWTWCNSSDSRKDELRIIQKQPRYQIGSEHESNMSTRERATFGRAYFPTI